MRKKRTNKLDILTKEYEVVVFVDEQGKDTFDDFSALVDSVTVSGLLTVPEVIVKIFFKDLWYSFRSHEECENFINQKKITYEMTDFGYDIFQVFTLPNGFNHKQKLGVIKVNKKVEKV